MAKIANVWIPDKKNILISLTYIKGIGRKRSEKILKNSDVDWKIKAEDLSYEQINKINREVNNFPIEGELDKILAERIKDQILNRTYKGQRRVLGLPVNGQSTRRNARTNKGPRKTVAGKKSAKLKK
ncbi:MAG TPA: 30S ribosomal protein S13 [Mycoplasmatales bacterium]|jgi:small subunit ribosomal protein S13|nr:30S ribosomal protein S13 [Mycoplasmatales bacterium]